MKALYKYETGGIRPRLVDLLIPEINDDFEVRIKVSAVAVCGMDIHIYHGRFPCTPPFVMGHEFVGIVEKIGNKVKDIKIGDRVIAQPHQYACMECDVCTIGAPQYCKDVRSLGISRDGAMAEYVVISEKYIHKIPSNIPDKVATLIEPMTLIVSDVILRAKLKKGETVAIIGAGQMAQLAVIAARAAGASKIIMTGLNIDEALRFKAAKALGVDYTINSQKENVVEKVMELTDGKGVDLIVEASGSESAINTSIDIIRVCGRMTLIGASKKDSINIRWDSMLKKMITLYFNMMSDYKAIDKAIEIFNNYPFDLSSLISHEARLEDWEYIFDELSRGNGIKAVFTLQ